MTLLQGGGYALTKDLQEALWFTWHRYNTDILTSYDMIMIIHSRLDSYIYHGDRAVWMQRDAVVEL